MVGADVAGDDGGTTLTPTSAAPHLLAAKDEVVVGPDGEIIAILSDNGVLVNGEWHRVPYVMLDTSSLAKPYLAVAMASLVIGLLGFGGVFGAPNAAETLFRDRGLSIGEYIYHRHRIGLCRIAKASTRNANNGEDWLEARPPQTHIGAVRVSGVWHGPKSLLEELLSRNVFTHNRVVDLIDRSKRCHDELRATKNFALMDEFEDALSIGSQDHIYHLIINKTVTLIIENPSAEAVFLFH